MIKQPKKPRSIQVNVPGSLSGEGEQTLFAQSADTGTQLWHFLPDGLDFPQKTFVSQPTVDRCFLDRRDGEKILVIQDDAQTEIFSRRY